MAIEWSGSRSLFINHGMYMNIITTLADAFFYLDSPALRVTGVDIPTPYAYNLEDLSFPKTHHIVEEVKRCLNK